MSCSEHFLHMKLLNEVGIHGTLTLYAKELNSREVSQPALDHKYLGSK